MLPGGRLFQARKLDVSDDERLENGTRPRKEGSEAMEATSLTRSAPKDGGLPAGRNRPAVNGEHGSLVVFSTLGTFGDVLPFVLLARQLRDRAHRIVFLANSNHETFVRSHGFDFIAICGAEDPTSGVDTDTFLVNEAIPAYRRTVEVIGALSTGSSRTVIVNRSGNWGGIFAGELHKLPRVSIMLQPGAVMPGGQPISPRVTGAVNAFRRAIGLPALRKSLIVDHASETISFFPDWFGYPESDLAEAGTCVGFPFASGSFPALPAAIQALVSERGRVVVFTAGTNMPQTNFFDLASQFALRTGLPVVALGHAGEAREVAGVVTSSFVDHASLFRFARLVIHNGGIGVTAQAMRAGVPQVVIPHVWDQPDNARRVEEIGIGRTILPVELSCERLIEVHGEIEALDETTRTTVVQAIQRSDAIAAAAALIERHVGQRSGHAAPVHGGT